MAKKSLIISERIPVNHEYNGEWLYTTCNEKINVEIYSQGSVRVACVRGGYMPFEEFERMKRLEVFKR